MHDFLERLAQILGAKHLITDYATLRTYTEERRGHYPSECLAVALPADSAQVAAVVRCCVEAGVSMVPQGGNTGTVGGSVAQAGQLVVNLGRMNRIREVDPANHAMRVQSGCILADIQAAAAAHDLLFPLSLGAEGSCHIGGNLATNAGGINVLRYGNARDLVLGLQVVLADGRIWENCGRLRKDNTGYDLKHLFIGSEGTLGIITEATLKLFPAPRARVVALAGLENVDAALALLNRLRVAVGDSLTTFELMGEITIRAAVAHCPGQTEPLNLRHNWYVLIVAADTAADGDSQLRRQMEACLAGALQQEVLQDAVIAANEGQAERLLRLRENIVEAQQLAGGGSLKHDIAVPLAAVPEFLRLAGAAVESAMPGARPYPFGHLGDGNIHYNISPPAGMNLAEFLAQRDRMNRVVHDIAHQLHGTFSAEHGIGLAKLAEMNRYKDAVSLDLCRRIKLVLDPHSLLNPGKLNP